MFLSQRRGRLWNIWQALSVLSDNIDIRHRSELCSLWRRDDAVDDRTGAGTGALQVTVGFVWDRRPQLAPLYILIYRFRCVNCPNIVTPPLVLLTRLTFVCLSLKVAVITVRTGEVTLLVSEVVPVELDQPAIWKYVNTTHSYQHSERGSLSRFSSWRTLWSRPRTGWIGWIGRQPAVWWEGWSWKWQNWSPCCCWAGCPGGRQWGTLWGPAGTECPGRLRHSALTTLTDTQYYNTGQQHQDSQHQQCHHVISLLSPLVNTNVWWNI